MNKEIFLQLLSATVQAGISDIHIKTGAPVLVRESGELVQVSEEQLSPNDVEQIVLLLMGMEDTPSKDRLNSVLDVDTSYSLSGIGRFRANIYRQRGSLAVTLRVIPSEVPNIESLGLPMVLKDIAGSARGMILVTGATGSGKSTTLAAIIDNINSNYAKKVITIEDPIEFLIRDKKSSISQREVGKDTKSFAHALRSALRQDPDVIMLGEMRDRESIEIALKASETGHLVLSTLHTTDAEGTVARLLGSFDYSDQDAVRLRLVDNVVAVISQRLIPRKNRDSRIAAVEVMRMTQAIQERITNADSRGFRDLIEAGTSPYRMQTFDQHLTELVKQNVINMEDAMSFASSPTNLKRNIMFQGI